MLYKNGWRKSHHNINKTRSGTDSVSLHWTQLDKRSQILIPWLRCSRHHVACHPSVNSSFPQSEDNQFNLITSSLFH